MTDKFVEAFTSLDPIGKQIVKIKLTHPTMTMKEIGSLVEPKPMSKELIFYHLKAKPEIQTCIDLIEMDVVRGLQSLYPLAIATLRKSLLSKNEIAALDASKFILKKVGDSEHMLPDRLDDTELQFIYNDIGGSDGKEDENQKAKIEKGEVTNGEKEKEKIQVEAAAKEKD